MKSENWNNCKLTVRTNIHTDLVCQTERQWAKQGYLKNDKDCGKELWINQFCRTKALYLFADEVHKASDEEVRAFFAPERERRNAKQRKLRAKQKAEAERQHDFNERRWKEFVRRDRTAVMAVLKRTLNGKRTIILDTETTGLDSSKDEILQLSIIDEQGNVLFNEHFKPIIATEWKVAESVNGISPQMVADCEDIYHYFSEIQQILYDADTIIGYNTDFDLAFLRSCDFQLYEDTETIDVMQEFAPIYGEQNENGYKWQKLAACAAYYNYDWGTATAHDSLADCRATLYCYNSIIAETSNNYDYIGLEQRERELLKRAELSDEEAVELKRIQDILEMTV